MRDEPLAKSALGGVRLRGWQAQESTASGYQSALPALRGGVEPSSAAAVSGSVTGVDIGEELETEALQRSQAELAGARLPFYADPQRAAQRRKRRQFERDGIRLACACGFALNAVALHSGLIAGVAAMWVCSMALQRCTRRVAVTPPTGPFLTLSDDGVQIGHGGLIFWSEIKTIRCLTLPGCRSALIVLHNPYMTLERLRDASNGGGQTRPPIRKQGRRIPRLFQPLFVLDESVTGVPVQELVGRINTFRTRRAV